MPKYFTHLASSNAPGNALQRAALDLLKRRSNRLIDDAQLFELEFQDDIRKLNTLHPRCRPLEPTARKLGSGSIGFFLGAAFTVTFNLHPVKEDENA